MILVISLCLPAYCADDAEAKSEPERIKIYEVAPPTTIQLTREMFSFELLDSHDSERIVYNERGIPEMEKTRTFVHDIVDFYQSPIAVMTVTVTGMYSQADNYAYRTAHINVGGHFVYKNSRRVSLNQELSCGSFLILCISVASFFDYHYSLVFTSDPCRKGFLLLSELLSSSK